MYVLFVFRIITACYIVAKYTLYYCPALIYWIQLCSSFETMCTVKGTMQIKLLWFNQHWRVTQVWFYGICKTAFIREFEVWIHQRDLSNTPCLWCADRLLPSSPRGQTGSMTSGFGTTSWSGTQATSSLMDQFSEIRLQWSLQRWDGKLHCNCFNCQSHMHQNITYKRYIQK